ncbi:signal transduction histidine kinase [Streptomyces sp. SPB4]|nr:nitrate- and nitrite sensing domain-containing protein [Streptomyces sp. SPB4]MDH6539725.1 signal transduction histidine kinase [Streptomyces sp. SPB4]
MRTSRRRPQAAAPRPAVPAVPPVRGRRAHAGPPAEEPPGPDPSAAPAGGASVGTRPRIRLRPATVRAKIVSLLMVPVVSLLGLWAFAAVAAAQDVARIGRERQADAEIRTPVAAALTELQAERRAAVRFLADPASDQASALEQQARRTDEAVRRLRLGSRHTVADSGDHHGDVVTRLDTFVSRAEGLAAARKDVTGRRATPDGAYAVYTEAADAALAVEGALSGGRDPETGPGSRVLLEFARAGEMLSREDVLLALPGPRTPDALRRLTGVVENRRTLTAATALDLPAAQRAAWESVAKSASYAELTGAEDKALAAATTAAPAGGATAQREAPKEASKEAPRGVPAGWEAAYTSVSGSMRDIRQAAGDGAVGRSDPLAEGLLGPAGAAVLLGLAAVAASLVISVRIGRTLVVELVALRNTALEIAHRKLPDAMERLRSGQAVDVDVDTGVDTGVDAAAVPARRTAEDEITQVAAALSTVHRAALSAAVERAEFASGVSGVFVNLARRSQVLVHKQLSLLDSMERRADDPGELDDLFRLDHLTTRMRRHAESLIILSGAAPGRAWRVPVPLTNVVRAAVSEIEDYPRVEVRGLAETAVVGASVADLTHLLAELIENATQFSPPHTKVRVSGEPVGAGYVLEVEDRGLGMGREVLADANRRIEHSEDLDLFDSDRLGLFVVSRLSSRHGVRVRLRPSPYGGTTAVVLLPNSLLQGAIESAPSTPDPDPASPAGDGAGRPERPAAVSVVRETVRGVPAPGRPSVPAPASGPAPVPAAPGAPEPQGSRPAPVAPLRPRGPGGTGTRTHPASAPAPGPAPALAAAPVGELPRRVRQASLVPQLREESGAGAPGNARTAEEPPDRSPEQARDRMAAFRAGWARGTRETSNPNGGPHKGSEGEV